MASTNILYIGDHFDPSTPVFDHLVEIAEKWNAAVDLAQLRESGEEPPEADGEESASELVELGVFKGGTLSKTALEEDVECAGGGVPETMDRLIQVGRAGRFRCFRGGVSVMLKGLAPATDYSLIVVGDVFSEKERTGQRLKRNVIALLSERFRVPVLGSEELKSQYLFGAKQLMSLGFSLGVAVIIYLLVFSFQKEILEFLSVDPASEGAMAQVLAAIAVALLIPIVAFSVGSFYKNILKLVKLE
jgi:hypothetical protein